MPLIILPCRLPGLALKSPPLAPVRPLAPPMPSPIERQGNALHVNVSPAWPGREARGVNLITLGQPRDAFRLDAAPEVEKRRPRTLSPFGPEAKERFKALKTPQKREKAAQAIAAAFVEEAFPLFLYPEAAPNGRTRVHEHFNRALHLALPENAVVTVAVDTEPLAAVQPFFQKAFRRVPAFETLRYRPYFHPQETRALSVGNRWRTHWRAPRVSLGQLHIFVPEPARDFTAEDWQRYLQPAIRAMLEDACALHAPPRRKQASPASPAQP